jgi:hypothetical protein
MGDRLECDQCHTGFPVDEWPGFTLARVPERSFELSEVEEEAWAKLSQGRAHFCSTICASRYFRALGRSALRMEFGDH